jgi:hypothetical protein
VIEITQFEKGMQLVPIGTEPVKRRVNAGDPPYRSMIGIYQSTPHIKATLQAVADLRSGCRSTKIASTARISKREREETERDCCDANLKESHESWGESKGSGPVGV